MLARQARQRAGFGDRKISAGACVARGLGEDVAAEGAGRKEHDLAIGQIRRELAAEVGLRERGQRREDEVRAFRGGGDVLGDKVNGNAARAAKILERDGARFTNGRQCRCVAAPEANFVARFAEVGGGGVAAVSAAENGDLEFIRQKRRSRCCSSPRKRGEEGRPQLPVL